MLSPHNNILVVSIRRSGGKLVRNLLDGHPAIKALPFEQWQTTKKARHPGESLARYAELGPTERLSVSGFYRQTARKILRLHGEQAHDEFVRLMEAGAAACGSSADLYEWFVRTYFTRFHNVTDIQRVRVVNHCGNLALLSPKELDAIFGPSTKIVIWRDPRAAYVSSRELAWTIKGQVFGALDLAKFCAQYRQAFEHYGEWLGPRLIFEHLVQDPTSCMRSLADSIDLEFADVLLVPTIMGRPSQANSSFGRSFGAVDSGAQADWQERLQPEERAVIESELKDVIYRLGYSMSEPRSLRAAGGSGR